MVVSRAAGWLAGRWRAGADWRVTRRRTRSEAARAPCGRLPPRESSTPTGMWESSRSTPHAERFARNGPRSRVQSESLPPRPLHLGPLFQLSSLPVRVREARLQRAAADCSPPAAVATWHYSPIADSVWRVYKGRKGVV